MMKTKTFTIVLIFVFMNALCLAVENPQSYLLNFPKVTLDGHIQV